MPVNENSQLSDDLESNELLTWLNKSLCTHFTKVEQICTGAAFCQLMHWLFPGSVLMRKVRCCAITQAEVVNNYRLLQSVYKKVGLTGTVPVEALLRMDAAAALEFLRCFKTFFDRFPPVGEYDALEARKGRRLGPKPARPRYQKRIPIMGRKERLARRLARWQLEAVARRARSRHQESAEERNTRASALYGTPGEIIVTISDDDEKEMEACIPYANGDVAPISSSEETPPASSSEEAGCVSSSEEAGGEPQSKGGVVAPCTDTLKSLMKKYMLPSGEEAELAMSHILSPDYRRDIALVCSHTPYCLYLYSGVELDAGVKATVLLVGYYDQSLGVSMLKLLDTRPSLSETNASSAETASPPGDRGALDPARLIAVLDGLGLSLCNLAAFYCGCPDLRLSSQLERRLRHFRPGLVSLCGLQDLAGRACSDGLQAAFGPVGELIQQVHHHFSNCSLPLRAALRETASSAHHFRPSIPIPNQCLFICHMVRKMTRDWQDLQDYFESLAPSPANLRICTLLGRQDLRLGAIFLSHALQPLCAFQELQCSASAKLQDQLQLIAALRHAYAARILRRSSVALYLKQPRPGMLHDASLLLPDPELQGSQAVRESLLGLSGSKGCLEVWELKAFLNNVVAFSRSVLESIVENTPEQLSYTTMQNIGLLVTPPLRRKDLESRGPLLRKTGEHLGLISPGSPECPTRDAVSDFDFSDKEESVTEAHGGERAWARVLRAMKRTSPLWTLLQVLLALPHSLNRDVVFNKVFSSRGSAASPVGPRSPENCPHLGVGDGAGEEEEEEDVALEEEEEYESDDTDYSSDVVVIEEDTHSTSAVSRRSKHPSIGRLVYESVASGSALTCPSPSSTGATSPPVYHITSMDSEDDWEDAQSITITHIPQTPGETAPPVALENDVPYVGRLVWGPRLGWSLWPGVARGPSSTDPQLALVEWYGEVGVFSEVPLESLQPSSAFSKCYCNKTFSINPIYRTAIFQFLQELASRCGKQFLVKNPRDLLGDMMSWVLDRPPPSSPLTGPTDPAPTNGGTERPQEKSGKRKSSLLPGGKRSRSSLPDHSQDSPAPAPPKRRRPGPPSAAGPGPGPETETRTEKAGRVERGRAPPQAVKSPGPTRTEVAESRPFCKKRGRRRMDEVEGDYVQRDQRDRETAISRIRKKGLDIEGFCLCCGVADIGTTHPLFKGGLCPRCKDNFTETLFRYDDDGYQSYCTICCYGMEVLLCGNHSCCRSFCLNCLDILVGPGTFASLKEVDPWICYLCQPQAAHGALEPRADWSIRVQEFFANNSAMEFEPHRVYPSIPANLRRPIRVLSLFDGIATGYLVLKDLGFKVDKYVASEVCPDSLAVSRVNHENKILYAEDVRLITAEQLVEWGPFDLLIGGSPCNDLSIVNPIRKGIYEGTGRLFFDFYRILHLLKPKEEEPRPFFWLFENVVFMNTHDKHNICRFLECHPVMVDAVKVSPAHRARYFWGNVPGMNRPIIPSQKDKLLLQQCLEVGREAQVPKVRTITTNPNSLKQGKKMHPVIENGKEDSLWITELETIFGFPKHYTDVRNMNRNQRQKVLGKSWSVPVIRHLFAPLKDYFACEELAGSPSCSSSLAPDCWS